MTNMIDRARDVPKNSLRGAVRRVLLVCGILSSLLYVVTTVLAAMQWEGYDSASQTISELFAIDAPPKSLVVPLFLLHGVLLIAFAIGVWESAGRRRALRVTGGLLIADGVVGLVTAAFFPIHLRGAEGTLTDTMHAILTAVLVLFILLAIGFGAGAFGPGFRLYSLVTLVTLIVFGALAGMEGSRLAANEPTPWLGVFERINIGGYLLWLLVLAVALLRTPASHQTRE
ncbi:hypothetical protein Aple_092850 [Acrocarpospora pleiomorpha]|uniref:DUF998 domain-containing protein n=1 Tax=Acrocarpospora pleiomorpha TaxID=90975 RepID=A0A5M3XZM7_9ACTN|nr:DUF998 domain-containing protein [Acrocarpospora pleiomorpha]GES26386.1 hypothetical protein Aple_092850 [Acrocarpospora pleiomorpha]